MKRMCVGWHVWLTRENFERRHKYVTESAKSLRFLSGQLHDTIVIKNACDIPLHIEVETPAKVAVLDKNYFDLPAMLVPYVHAKQSARDYFCYLYDDFVVFRDSFDDCIKFLDANPRIDNMRIPLYVPRDKKFMSEFTKKSINPEAVSHSSGAGKEKLIHVGPVSVGKSQFYASNWLPNSRPMIWRTSSYDKFFDMLGSTLHIMQPHEKKMYDIADELSRRGEYASSFMSGGMCHTFPAVTSERERSESLDNNFDNTSFKKDEIVKTISEALNVMS